MEEDGKDTRRILHDVANRCTSMGVSASLIRERVQESALPRLDKLVQLLKSQPDAATVAKAAVFAEGIAAKLREESDEILDETRAIADDLEVIRQLVHAGRQTP